MSSAQSTKDSTKDTAEQTKNYGAEKAGQVQEGAKDMGHATKDKTAEGKDQTSSGLEQVRMSLSRSLIWSDHQLQSGMSCGWKPWFLFAHGCVRRLRIECLSEWPSVHWFSQAGEKVKDGMAHAKETVTGDKQ